jgi:tripartite-type tricarboxylate transporter receptor subunit TctC
MIQRRDFIAHSASAAAILLSAAPFVAQAQMLDTARVLVGFPAGGTVDALARRLAEKLRGPFAKNTVVENKPGAGGRLAAEELKRSAADGTSLLVTPAAMITLYPHLYSKLAYSPDDVVAVAGAATVAFAFGVGPAVPDSVKNIKDFLAWVKANPGKGNYGSPGAGSPPHMLAALLGKESGVELSHIPYRGSAPGIQDLLGGQVTAFSSPIGDYLPHVKTGKLRVLATSGAKRSRFLPDVPTYTEQGFKALEQVEWYGVFMPAKTPAELVNRAANSIRELLAAAETADALAQFGLEVNYQSPADLARAVRAENTAWGPIVKTVGFTPEQ